MNTYDEMVLRVFRGAEWLDKMAELKLVPRKWWDEVDLDILDMRRGDRCILGQLFDRFTRSPHSCGFSWILLNEILSDGEIMHFGFCSIEGVWGSTDLDEAWKSLILECRSASGW